YTQHSLDVFAGICGNLATIPFKQASRCQALLITIRILAFRFRYFISDLTLKLLPGFARIVRWIDVIDFPGPLAMKLNDRLLRGPREMFHLRRKKAESSCRHRIAFRLIELLPHAKIELAGNNRNVLDL